MDLAALLAGPDDHLADEGTQRLGGLSSPIGIVQSLSKPRDIAAVVYRHVRINIRHISRSSRHAGGDLGLLSFQLVHPGLH